MKISVILTTYNRPDALDKVLHGFAAQTDKSFELLVADDGSSDATKTLLQGWQATLPLKHVWHEDRGFRAAAIRNEAVRQSTGDYVVFVDGDCIPRPDFIAQHAKLAEAGCFVAGNRILLNPQGQANRWSWLASVRLPNGAWRMFTAQRWQGVHTCNLGVWKQDLLNINGLDESFVGWGHEDADLAVRLLRAGVRRKNGRFATTVTHLWHPENDRSHLPENRQRLKDILASNSIRCEHGLS